MSDKKTHKTSVGGQALIEGVMMQGPKGVATAVRKPDGDICVEHHEVKHLKDKNKFWGFPLIRGIVGFFESMMLGYKMLMYSAEVSGMEDIEDAEMNKFEKWITDKLGDKFMTLIMGIATVLGFALAFLIFFYLPVLAFNRLNVWADGSLAPWQGTIEGVIKIIIFVVYIALVSRMNDIKRTFMYHGAEHKCINCLENGLELTVENARKQTTVHKRCGTSFMLVVMFVSILFFMFISVSTLWLRMLLRVLLIPVIAGLSYEFIIFAGKTENPVMTILSKPGLWLQSLTTKEPEDEMLEVAISSVEAVFDWKKFLEESAEQPAQQEPTQEETDENIEEAAATDEKSELEAAGFEVVEVSDNEEDDEILQALDRYFDDPEK